MGRTACTEPQCPVQGVHCTFFCHRFGGGQFIWGVGCPQVYKNLQSLIMYCFVRRIIVKYGLHLEVTECSGAVLADAMLYGSLVYRNGSDPH
jgi:hypothetical protein